MSTDLPKIQGYVPHAVYDKLVKFKATRNLKSISLAVTAALEDYFEIGKNDSQVKQSELLVKRVEFLEGKVSSLSEELSVLNQVIKAADADKNHLREQINQLTDIFGTTQGIIKNVLDKVDYGNLRVNQTNSPKPLQDAQVNETTAAVKGLAPDQKPFKGFGKPK